MSKVQSIKRETNGYEEKGSNELVRGVELNLVVEYLLMLLPVLVLHRDLDAFSFDRRPTSRRRVVESLRGNLAGREKRKGQPAFDATEMRSLSMFTHVVPCIRSHDRLHRVSEIDPRRDQASSSRHRDGSSRVSNDDEKGEKESCTSRVTGEDAERKQRR